MGDFIVKKKFYICICLILSFILAGLNFSFSYFKDVENYNSLSLVLKSEINRVTRHPQIITTLEAFLEGEVTEIKQTIHDGSYRIQIFAVDLGFAKDTDSSKIIGVRVYDEDKPICSFVLYELDSPGLFNNALEISRRMENGQDINIGSTVEQILGLLKEKASLPPKRFKRFDKNTFKQIESRMAHIIYKQKYEELRQRGNESPLEAFILTVNEIKKISFYEIMPSYVAEFLSKTKIGKFDYFGMYYDMIKKSEERFEIGIPELRRIVERLKSESLLFKNDSYLLAEEIRKEYFSGYARDRVWELLYNLSFFRIADFR